MYNKYFSSVCMGLISILFVAGIFTASALALEGKEGEVIKTLDDLKSLEAKGLLTKGQVICFTELIKDFGAQIPIVKTTNRKLEASVSKTYLKVTEENKGKSKIGSNDELLDYKGGLPFPDIKPDDPKAGLKAFYNYDHKHAGDDFRQHNWIYRLLDAKGNTKILEGDSNRIYVNWRTDVDPKPSLGLEAEVWLRDYIGFLAPFASKGLCQLALRYTDSSKAKDIWMYVPGLRRTTRIGGGNRCDSLGGFVFTIDYGECWCGDTPTFNYKVLEVKDILCATYMGWEYTREGRGKNLYMQGAHHHKPILERRKVWVIEQTPKDPNYCIKKGIFYQDPENWFFVWEDLFDSEGRLWKSNDLDLGVFPNKEAAGGGFWIQNISGTNVDYRIWETAPYVHQNMTFNEGISPDLFTLDALRRAGR